MKKIRLALIAGGKSDEREVSLKGASGVAAALDPEKYTVTRYDPASDLARLATDAGKLDAAFILLHGLYGEDGTIQGILLMNGVFSIVELKDHNRLEPPPVLPRGRA